MRKKRIVGSLLVLGLCMVGSRPATAADSVYGKVTAVKSAEVVVLGRYDIRIAGIEAPDEGPMARKAKQFVSDLVLGKEVRTRFEQRNKRGEMVSRLFVDGKEVGVELVRLGLARRQANYDYKYGELSKAENEAREAKRGLWALAEPPQ